MRKVIGGDGSDTTAATQTYLNQNDAPTIRDLYIIGAPENPKALFMTDYDRPLLYSPYGTFSPAVVKRDNVTAKIGLEAQDLNITWTPGATAQSSASVNTRTASPYQLAANHFYDNWPVLVLRCFIPTPGDANTLGCAVWFGGRVQTCEVKRNAIVFNTKSYIDVLKQKVPSTVIETTSTLASTTAVTKPAGDATSPIFKCFAGSTENYIIADCQTPVLNKIYSGNLFAGGYMVFLPGAGATLAGIWSAIGQNGNYTDGFGNHHSEFEIYAPLPWPPTPGVDTFYVSMAPPINLGDSGYYGFPYVPSAQTAV